MKLFVNGPVVSENYQKLSAALLGSGINVVSALEDFDFALPLFDPITQECADIATAKGKYFPDTGFITKSGLETKCLASGVSMLPKTLLTIENLRACTHSHFIIKPDLWSGAKHPYPYVYRIFTMSQIEDVVSMIGSNSTDGFIIQNAYIDESTQETYLLFVDGVVNGSGVVHFNPIADKWMLNTSTDDGHITHKAGIREVSSDDKFGFKAKVLKLLQDNNIRNTPFKAQAIVDVPNGQCFITDWSWGIMPYTHLNVLTPDYLADHLKFAYDMSATVTKPIDKAIVMHHIAFPKEDWNLSTEDFDQKYASASQAAGVKRAEQLRSRGSVQPTVSNFYVLFGVAAGSVDDGRTKLTAFQSQVSSV
jgi:hypothetical protein